MKSMAEEPILVVDDDESILEAFQLILEDKGYKVVTASTGRQAIEKAKENRFHVAIVDIVLPDVRGDKVALELHAIDELIEILFITGFSEYIHCLDAIGIGFCDILLKPINIDVLLDAVKRATNLRAHMEYRAFAK